MKHWIDHTLSEVFGKYINQYLLGFGIEAAIVVLLAPVLAYIGVKAFWGVLTPTPEPNWEALHPGDDDLMRSAFNDVHVVASLARLLDENDAANLDEFKAQIRRVGLYREHGPPPEPKRIESVSLYSSLKVLGMAALVLGLALLAVLGGMGVAAFRHWMGWY